MNDVMDTVKMLEVTVIDNVPSMVFTVVTRVRRMAARVRSMSTRMPPVTTMTTAMAATLAVCSRGSSHNN